MRYIFMACFIVGCVIGCALKISHRTDLSNVYCTPLEPAPMPSLYCYPVDKLSGQQVCVRQVFNSQEVW